jgi:hypothetical protein
MGESGQRAAGLMMALLGLLLCGMAVVMEGGLLVLVLACLGAPLLFLGAMFFAKSYFDL